MYSSTQKSVKHLGTVTKGIYKVSDNFIEESERQFFSQSDNVNILKELYEWEVSKNEFTYIIASSQYFYAENRSFPDKFEVGYNSSYSTTDTYNSLQVNNAFIEHFKLTVNQGRLFNKQDYIIDNDLLPIIMGYEYIPYCTLGDKITVYYLGRNFECVIVGFLSEKSYFNNSYNIECLDRHILMPSLEIAKNISNTTDIIDLEQKKFELKLYLDKCSGYLYSKCSANVLQNMFSKKCYDLDIVPYTIEGFSSFYPTMWGLEGKQFQKLLLIFTIIISITSILCTSINMVAKIMVLKRNYSIYIMNGTSSKAIYISILLEILIINFLALFVASIFGYSVYGNIPIVKLTLIYLGICITSSVYPLLMVNKINISRILRGDD